MNFDTFRTLVDFKTYISILDFVYELETIAEEDLKDCFKENAKCVH